MAQPQYAPGGQPGYPPGGQPGYPPYGANPGMGYPQPGGYAPYPPPTGQPIGMQPMSMGQPGVGFQPGFQQYAPNPQIAPAAFPGQPNQAGGGENWMPIPQNVPHCPPGLAYLTTIDQLLVKQKVELLEGKKSLFSRILLLTCKGMEQDCVVDNSITYDDFLMSNNIIPVAFTGFETANKYSIKNSLGQKLFHAKEQSDCCTRNLCGPMRPFDMKIVDNYDNEVIHLSRPLACSSCWFPCCLQNMEVSAPPGSIIGYVEQEWSICVPKFSIKNANHDEVLRIEGPFCTWSMCGDVEFQVLSRDGSTQVGKISKQWSGLAREAFTDADNFGITFPLDLDVNMKAVMLGACFLIDFMFFEKSGNKESDGLGML